MKTKYTTKYTKKQITEAIAHWQKILNEGWSFNKAKERVEALYNTLKDECKTIKYKGKDCLDPNHVIKWGNTGGIGEAKEIIEEISWEHGDINSEDNSVLYWESFFKDLVDAIENKDLDKIKEITSYEVWNYPINNVYDPETPKLSKLANRVIQERINWYISHRDYLDNEIFKDKEWDDEGYYTKGYISKIDISNDSIGNAPANRLYYIYSGTFNQLPNLTYVDLYNLKIKEICGNKFSGENAFYDCKNLQSVYINGNFLNFISSAAFGKCNKVTLYICVESKDLKIMENKIKRMSGYPFGLRPEQIKITTY